MFFKLKDLMTSGNILGGIGSVFVAMEGMRVATTSDGAFTYVFWSGFLILIAYIFDAFDGVVARVLKSSNKFGAEFDNVADLVSYSIAPSFLIYLAYRKASFLLSFSSSIAIPISLIVAVSPAIMGSIRFARFNAVRMEYPGYWIGLPRPASALLILSFLNSHFFKSESAFQIFGIPLILLLSFLNVTLIPYKGHHGGKFSLYLKVILTYVVISVIVSFVGGVILEILPRNFVFDMIFIWLFCYIFMQLADIHPNTMKDLKFLINKWKQEI